MMELKEFEKLLKICRKQGITDLTYQGITVKFGEMPSKEITDQSNDIQTDELNADQMMFYHIRDGERTI